jgi:hypothetical protein
LERKQPQDSPHDADWHPLSLYEGIPTMHTAATDSPRTDHETTGIDCSERAKRTMLDVNERIGGRFDAFAGRLSMAIRDLVVLKTRGANEAELRLIPIAMHHAIDDLFHPLTPDAERVARRLESDADRKEDALSDLTLIDGESPASVGRTRPRAPRGSRRRAHLGPRAGREVAEGPSVPVHRAPAVGREGVVMRMTTGRTVGTPSARAAKTRRREGRSRRRSDRREA